MTSNEDRAGYIAGLRQLATILEEHPGIPLPYDGTTGAVSIFLRGSPGEAASAARAIPVTWTRKPESPGSEFLNFDGHLAGLRLRVHIDRPAAEAPPETEAERACIAAMTAPRPVPATAPQPAIAARDGVIWKGAPDADHHDDPATTEAQEETAYNAGCLS